MDFPVRVLCVMSTLDRGGAESMVMSLFRHIDTNKVVFDFVKHTNSIGEFEDEIKKIGGKVFSAPRYRLYNHFQYIRWWKRFLNKHPEYLIIHGHFFTISSVYFSVAKRAGRITVGHSHSTEIPKDQIKNYVIHWISNELIKRIEDYSDYALACSKNAGDWIFKKKKYLVLNNAVDSEIFKFDPKVRKCYRQQMGIADSYVLGTVANLSSIKNPMGLIDIFIEVKKILNNAILLWAGEGDQRSSIEERIKKEKLEGSILLLGRREDVAHLLQAMDVFLLPSYSEGLPVSVIEAQAAGLPCYISDKITREVDATGLCEFLPINDSLIWAKKITDRQKTREDTSNIIKSAGYDIKLTSKWLQDFYLNIVTNNFW